MVAFFMDANESGISGVSKFIHHCLGYYVKVCGVGGIVKE